ncbi:MAG: hypothetical protein ABL997_04065, partial [Planctomycetota bacterium]
MTRGASGRRRSVEGRTRGRAGLVSGASIDLPLLTMTERFERHRQPWTPTEIQKLHQMANKGMS